ncbi:hypothetical protein FMEAI12_3640066 [Parafrankia sp. Ea1.12]|nr:hypothetical protein FMEAI12_3640066 [Parafrankia sp. Ea1.12]
MGRSHQFRRDVIRVETGLSARMSIASPSCSRRRCHGRHVTVGYGDGVGLHLSQITEADELLTNDPLALLIDMVLDHAGFGKNE